MVSKSISCVQAPTSEPSDRYFLGGNIPSSIPIWIQSVLAYPFCSACLPLLVLSVILLMSFFPSLSGAEIPGSFSSSATSQQADDLFEQERFEKALSLYEKLKNTYPEDTRYHRRFQDCLRVLDREKQALRFYREQLRLQPRNPQSWYLLGRLLDDEPEGRRYLTKAIRLGPQYPWGYYGLAVHQGNREQYRSALPLVRRAIALDIDEPKAHYLEGYFCQKLDQDQQAIEAYRQFLQEDSHFKYRDLIANRIWWLSGDVAPLRFYLVMALVPTILWLYYTRRRMWLVGPFSWKLATVLVAAGAGLSCWLLADWLYELIRPQLREINYLHPLPYRLAKHFLFVGPIEEFAKWIVVLVLAYWTGRIRHPLDGMICAAWVAIGFALAENVKYMWWEGWPKIINRGLLCVPVHLVVSAIWGYGLGLARITVDRRKAWLGAGLSLMAGAGLHGLYNSSVEFLRWEDASELELYAAWSPLAAMAFLIWFFRRYVGRARLWSPLFRKSLALKRQVATCLNADLLHRALKLKTGSPKARRHWSAAVNIVTQETLERLRRRLSPEQAQQLEILLKDRKHPSRDVLDFWGDVRDIQAVVEEACQSFENLLERKKSHTWKERKKLRKMKRRIAHEIHLESVPWGPVRSYKEYPVDVSS
jgi:RsiW-degrading membrane proteinase PrsW (M82 family)